MTAIPVGVRSAAVKRDDLTATLRAQATKNALRALGSSTLTFVLTIVAVLGLWVGVLWAFKVSPMIAKEIGRAHV